MKKYKLNYILPLCLFVLLNLLLFSLPSVGLSQETLTAQVLYDQGKLQEAAWQFSVEKQYDKAHKVYDEIEQILLESIIDTVRTDPNKDLRGITKTFRIYFLNTRITALFKEHTVGEIDRVHFERAAYELSRELYFDFVPVVVIRTIVINGNSLTGSLMYWIDDAISAKSAGLSNFDMPDKLRFFDALIGNVDRHLENWLYTSQKMIIAIDHNLSFFHNRKNWLIHLRNMHDPEKIIKSIQYQKFQELSKTRFENILANINSKKRKDAWIVWQKILFELERFTKTVGVSMTTSSWSGFVCFNLDEPILTKKSLVEKSLLKIVKKHLPYQGFGSRLDGLFSVLIRTNDGETVSALGGLKVFRRDARRIQKILIDAGFIVKK